jgi:hypothetical protein
MCRCNIKEEEEETSSSFDPVNEPLEEGGDPRCYICLLLHDPHPLHLYPLVAIDLRRCWGGAWLCVDHSNIFTICPCGKWIIDKRRNTPVPMLGSQTTMFLCQPCEQAYHQSTALKLQSNGGSDDAAAVELHINGGSKKRKLIRIDLTLELEDGGKISKCIDLTSEPEGKAKLTPIEVDAPPKKNTDFCKDLSY